MKIRYWVPENMMFEDAGTCLDTCPDAGAAALVVSHVAYDKAIAALKEISDAAILTVPSVTYLGLIAERALKELEQD